MERQSAMERQSYDSDVSDEQWALFEPLLEPESKKKSGRPRTANRREIVNAIFYVLKTGCQWRQLPHEFPTWSTVYVYYRRWRVAGIWQRAHESLHRQVRRKAGKEETPTAAILDSQSVKTSQKGGRAALMRARK